MIEAMANGTPVIGFRRGSAPEIIDDGVTGYVIDNTDAAVAVLPRALKLDRRAKASPKPLTLCGDWSHPRTVTAPTRALAADQPWFPTRGRKTTSMPA